MRKGRAIGPLLVLVLVLAACGDDDSTDAGTTSTTEDDEAGVPSTTSAPTGTSTSPIEVPLDDIALALTPVAEADAPTSLIARPGSSMLYLAGQEGTVRPLTPTGPGPDAELEVGDPVLDISDDVVAKGEQGLLDIEFSNDGATLYVHYSLDPSGDTRIVSYAMAGDAPDPASRRQLLALEQPYANHNGGEIEIGPDGYLYVGLGDGGSSGDPHGNGQDTDTLLGKILRVDPTRPTGGRQYGIPADNPFADGDGGRPEIWLYGVRNPWRFSFDAANGDLWLADVGEGDWEEIDLLPAADGAGRAANLGWDEMEGIHSFRDGRNPDGAVLPVFEYSHDEGCSVTGGVVYRGAAIPGLGGAYLFADFCQGELRALRVRDGEVAEERTFDAQVDELSSFGTDADGEVYVLSLDGTIYRLVSGQDQDEE